MSRVVITGLGPISAVGAGKENFFKGLGEWHSGITEIDSFDTVPYGSRLAAVVGDFRVEDFVKSPKTYLDRCTAFALASAGLAAADAGLKAPEAAGVSAGLAVGTAFGSLETAGLFFRDLVRKGPRLVKPFLFPHAYSNTSASLTAMEYGLKGPHMNFASGAVSGGHALSWSADLISRGRVTVMFAAGCDSLNEILFAGYALSGRLSPGSGGEEICAPFDRNANGMILGEGAATVILEERQHALRRKTHLYGEIRGVGMSGAAGNGELPERAIVEAMQSAVERSGISASDIDYICASAPGCPSADAAEAGAMESFLAEAGGRVPVSSIKAAVGETLGASALMQVCAAAGVLETGRVPPSLNLKNPVETDSLELFGPKELEKPARNVLINCVDEGGSAVCIVMGAV
ncbi:MAG: beta-ketoacyl synthase N-terminal-like domain-containing protein [Kiritimatiellia bacterium]